MFDINAKLGHWPYRPVRGVEALLEAMDANGVERAAVSSLSAVHFLSPQDGNDELMGLIASHPDRLIPFAVLRPNFAGWMDDLRICLGGYGMRGVVLYPNYHDFSLTDPALAPLMTEASRLRFPVCVQAGLEDERRQFRNFKISEVTATDIGVFARSFPDATVIAFGLKFGQPELMGEPLPANAHFDTSNYETLGDLENAAQRFGAHKILLGSNFPLFNPHANVHKLQQADLPQDARNAIARENALRILGEFWGTIS